MAWIESHQSLLTHRKTGRLSRALNISRVTAIGHLHALWWWSMDNAPSGALAGIDVEDIAEGACWEGDATAFLEALAYAGFVDATPDGPALHHWADYAGKLIEHRKSEAERKRRERTSARQPQYVRSTSAVRPQDIHSTSAATIPYHTQPNHTQPDLAAAHGADVAEASATPDDGAGLTPPRTGATPQRAKEKTEKPNAAPPKEAPKERPRNALWDALTTAFYEPSTAPERQKFGKVVHDLAAVNATAAEIAQRVQHHGDGIASGAISWSLTPLALVSHWSELATPPKAIPRSSLARASPNGKHPEPEPFYLVGPSKPRGE